MKQALLFFYLFTFMVYLLWHKDNSPVIGELLIQVTEEINIRKQIFDKTPSRMVWNAYLNKPAGMQLTISV